MGRKWAVEELLPRLSLCFKRSSVLKTNFNVDTEEETASLSASYLQRIVVQHALPVSLITLAAAVAAAVAVAAGNASCIPAAPTAAAPAPWVLAAAAADASFSIQLLLLLLLLLLLFCRLLLLRQLLACVLLLFGKLLLLRNFLAFVLLLLLLWFGVYVHQKLAEALPPDLAVERVAPLLIEGLQVSCCFVVFSLV